MSKLYYTAWSQCAYVVLDASAERCGDEHMRRYSLWICNGVSILSLHTTYIVQVTYLVLALDLFEHSVCRCLRLAWPESTSLVPRWSGRRGFARGGFSAFSHAPRGYRVRTSTHGWFLWRWALFSIQGDFGCALADTSATRLWARVALWFALHVSS